MKDDASGHHVHLVDGTFELFRCFHGAPLATAQGREVGAVRGLLQTLAALLREPEVTHVAVAVDAAVDAPPSKATGPDGQHGLAADAIRALGIVLWPTVRRFEADDALATGAARYAEHPDVAQVVICTTDKDLAQCVRGERVVVRDRIRNTTLDEAGVIAKFGVPPTSIPDYLALVGDPGDGIPGVPGWGKRSAGVVLTRYGHLEAIPPDPTTWDVTVRGAARLASTLAERNAEALLCRDMATLALDVPIRAPLDDLRWRGPKGAALEALCARIEDDSVLERLPEPEGPAL